MALFHISEDPPGQRSVAFVYDPLLVTKIKTNHGYQCEPTGKFWRLPDANGILLSKNFRR